MGTESPLEEDVDRLVGMLSQSFGGTECRVAERFMLMVPADVVPLNADYERMSEPKPVIVRDISVSGVAVLTHEKFDAPFLLLEFGETYDNTALVFSLIRVEPVLSTTSPDTSALFTCAGPFVKNGIKR